MSRPINISSAATFIPSSYNSSLQSGAISASTTGTYSVNNGLNSSANTSSYAMFSGTTQNTDGFAYYDFNVTGIPENATINSVSCTARGRASGNNRGTFGFQLCNGTSGKGSEVTSTTSTTTALTLNTGTWTVNELSNVKLRIRLRRTGNNSFGFRFYGATLGISYSVNGTEYEITAESTYTGATVSPPSQYIFGGNSGDVTIYADDISNLVVEDNGSDVTENLQYVVPQGNQQTFTGVPTSYDTVNSSYASTYNGENAVNGIYNGNEISNGYTNTGSTTRAAIYSNSGSSAETYFYYKFDCSSIPQNAIIQSVSCSVKCGNQGTTYYSVREVQMCNGTTPKGSPTTSTGSNTGATVHSLTVGTWTREELNDCSVRFYLKRVSGTGTGATSMSTFSFYGATLIVYYTLPQDPYYVYTISNINDDHDVVVRESIFIPPEEDPEKTYYSLTISSINATTEPHRGTTRVESGDNQTITITPSDPQMTLILDNGVDVSSQLVAHGNTIPQPTITTAQGASYGFVYSASTGYYISNNKGVSKSAAVCVLNFDLPVRCLVTIQYINYAEATYDFGVFGNIDVPLSNNYYAAGSGGATITDNDYKLACNTSTYNTSSVQTITYEIPSGEHSIYIKYSKDDASDSYNDTLQFKIANIEALEPNNYYTYTLSNINQDHSLIFIFGDVTYYFITSSLNGDAKLYPNGQIVQLPGESYKLVIVPSNQNDNISITDNNVNVTNSLEKKEETIEKDGNYVTVVNYIYTLTNIQTGHTIYVTSSPNISLKIKVQGNWVSVQKIYTKNGNSWDEIDDLNGLFEDGIIYLKG